MLGIGTPELIVILLIVVLLVGGKKLPELARSVGESVNELRKGMSNDQTQTKNKQQSAEETEDS